MGAALTMPFTGPADDVYGPGRAPRSWAGPFVLPDASGDDVLAGVVSWGQGCADAGYPGVCTRLATYSDEVLAQVNP